MWRWVWSPLSGGCCRMGLPLSLGRDVPQPLLASPGCDQCGCLGRSSNASYVDHRGRILHAWGAEFFYLVIALGLVSSHIQSLCINTKGIYPAGKINLSAYRETVRPGTAVSFSRGESPKRLTSWLIYEQRRAGSDCGRAREPPQACFLEPWRQSEPRVAFRH